jgi:hypothetical protein
MKNSKIYNIWTQFINDPKYKIYFESNEELWMKTLDKIKLYIDTNNKRLSTHDKGIKIKQLGIWINCQQKNYKKKEFIMKNSEIYNLWTDFMNDSKYKVYFECTR